MHRRSRPITPHQIVTFRTFNSFYARPMAALLDPEGQNAEAAMSLSSRSYANLS